MLVYHSAHGQRKRILNEKAILNFCWKIITNLFECNNKSSFHNYVVSFRF